MNNKDYIGSLIVIIIGVIIILYVFVDALKLSHQTVDDFDSFEGVVMAIKNDKVWLAKDSTVDIHKIGNDYIYFQVNDLNVLLKLKSVCHDWNHIVKVWFVTSSKGSRSHYPSHTTYLIEQIALNGEILLQYENNVFWRMLLFPIFPILGIIFYLLSGIIKNENDNKKQ